MLVLAAPLESSLSLKYGNQGILIPSYELEVEKPPGDLKSDK
jgi:hypothetical protein